MKAFDYWLSLKGDQAFPLFRDLKPEGLAPFKNNSLLLELTDGGAIIRFLGTQVGSLIDAPIEKGADLADYSHDTFAQALLGQFETAEGRAKAAEFEFVEGTLNCRGIMLPFSHNGTIPHFAMVVVNFSRRENIEHGDSYQLDEAIGASQRAAKKVAHLDGGSRGSLYHALAAALALYEEAERAPGVFTALLKDHGLKAQKRAPYTPALKLTFGKDYDKTRLTEYAAALAYATRQGETSESVAAFLENEPGGIKGCVRRERAARRGQPGSAAERRQTIAAKRVRDAAPIDLADIQTDKEFCLVIARRADDGSLEAVGLAETGQNTIDAAIRRYAEKIK